MNHEDIIFGAKSIISGMFRYNKKTGDIDDSSFIPMLKMCIRSTVEDLRQAGLSESEINAIHEELYQYSLGEYVKTWLSNAREDEAHIDEEQEEGDAKDSFVSFYEEDEHG